MSSLGHALRPDRTLKDASEMTWTFDADEALPFPSDTMSGSGITLPCLPSPARGISGVRQTTCISHLPYRFRHRLDSPSDPVQAHGVTKRKVSRFPLALSPKMKKTRSCTSCEGTHVTSGVDTRQTPSNLTGIRTMETMAWQLDA
jgi:hypothetical protein